MKRQPPPMHTESLLMEEAFLRIVATLAYRCWRRLPPSAKAHWDVEDLIAEGVANLVKECGKYNPERAPSPSTFVYMVTRDHFKDLALRYQRAQRFGTVVSLEKTESVLASADSQIVFLEAVRAVEALTDLTQEVNMRNVRVLAYILGGNDSGLRRLCKRTSVQELAESETVRVLRALMEANGIDREVVDIIRHNVSQ